MDLSTRASSGGDSNDSGNGRRRSGGGSRPAKSVFSIRSLVGEDTAVRRERDSDDRDDDSQPDGDQALRSRRDVKDRGNDGEDEGKLYKK